MKIKTRLLKAMANPEVINMLISIHENEKKKPTLALKEKERVEELTAICCDKISWYISRNLKLQ